jgi:SAM-dependent methyltransferase
MNMSMDKKVEPKTSNADQPYDESFYDFIAKSSRQSAKEIVPLVLEFFRPQSVVDVGCGTGAWLSVFREQGIRDILGIDGGYVDVSSLLVPEESFQAHDLVRPLKIGRKFDLVVSLEVAEHISPQYAKTFVESLVCLGPVVIFSAAIPYQGGVNHVNEQWQDYWRNLFNEKGFEAVDFVRKRVWNNPRVEPWFAQNIVMYIQKDYLNENPLLKEEWKKTDFPLSVVHPKHYENLVLLNNVGLRRTLQAMPKMIFEAVLRKLKGE